MSSYLPCAPSGWPVPAAPSVFAVVNRGPGLDVVLEGAGWAPYPESQTGPGLTWLPGPATPPHRVCPGKGIIPAGLVVTGPTEADGRSRSLGRGIGSVSDFEACGLCGPCTCLAGGGSQAAVGPTEPLALLGASVPRPQGRSEGQAALLNHPRGENGWGSRPTLLLGESNLLGIGGIFFSSRHICCQGTTTTAKIIVTRMVVFTTSPGLRAQSH